MGAMVRNDVLDFGTATASQPMGRLFSFKTGHAELSTSHRAWLNQYIVPLLTGGGREVYIRLWGYASKVGPQGLNQRLSVQRSNAVKNYLEQQVGMSLKSVETGGYGSSRSAGKERDNNPIYRAVDVYVHRTSVPPPPPIRPPDVTPFTPKMYIGLGVKFGGMLAIGGRQTIEAHLYSADSYADQFNLMAGIWTAGLGLGGGANVVLVIAYGGEKRGDFSGLKFDGWDFAASLGERWGDVAKAAKGVSAVARVADAIQKGNRSRQALSALTRLSPEQWEKLGDLAKTARDAHDSNSMAKKPQLNVFDIPLAGLAVELSLYKWWGTVEMIF